MNENTTVSVPGIEAQFDELDGWRPLMRRLQQKAGAGCTSIVTVRVLVDEAGQPQHWSEPTVCRIEPRARGEQLAALLQALAGGE